jgi:hypothetical protein
MPVNHLGYRLFQSAVPLRHENVGHRGVVGFGSPSGFRKPDTHEKGCEQFYLGHSVSSGSP